MEELKKRKAEMNLQKYRKKLKVKQHMEKKSLEDFRFANRHYQISCLHHYVKLWLIISELQLQIRKGWDSM